MKRIAIGLVAVITVVGCQASESEAPAIPSQGAETAAAPASPVATDPALLPFLQGRTRDAMAPLRYVVRTHGEGADQLTVVYLSGPEYCGSGGCNLLILGRSGDGYTVLGETSVTNPPIRILSTQTNGRPDIGVHVAGGGTTEGYEARLAFDGSRYPSNPTVPPAERVENAPGVVLIDDNAQSKVLKEQAPTSPAA